MERSRRVIKFKTKDNVLVSFKYSIIKKSSIVQRQLYILEKNGYGYNFIPFPMVHSSTLKSLKAWAVHHKDEDIFNQQKVVTLQNCRNWDDSFFQANDKNMDSLIMGARYLGMHGFLSMSRIYALKKYFLKSQNIRKQITKDLRRKTTIQSIDEAAVMQLFEEYVPTVEFLHAEPTNCVLEELKAAASLSKKSLTHINNLSESTKQIYAQHLKPTTTKITKPLPSRAHYIIKNVSDIVPIANVRSHSLKKITISKKMQNIGVQTSALKKPAYKSVGVLTETIEIQNIGVQTSTLKKPSYKSIGVLTETVEIQNIGVQTTKLKQTEYSFIDVETSMRIVQKLLMDTKCKCFKLQLESAQFRNESNQLETKSSNTATLLEPYTTKHILKTNEIANIVQMKPVFATVELEASVEFLPDSLLSALNPNKEYKSVAQQTDSNVLFDKSVQTDYLNMKNKKVQTVEVVNIKSPQVAMRSVDVQVSKESLSQSTDMNYLSTLELSNRFNESNSLTAVDSLDKSCKRGSLNILPQFKFNREVQRYDVGVQVSTETLNEPINALKNADLGTCSVGVFTEMISQSSKAPCRDMCSVSTQVSAENLNAPINQNIAECLETSSVGVQVTMNRISQQSVGIQVSSDILYQATANSIGALANKTQTTEVGTQTSINKIAQPLSRAKKQYIDLCAMSDQKLSEISNESIYKPKAYYSDTCLVVKQESLDNICQTTNETKIQWSNKSSMGVKVLTELSNEPTYQAKVEYLETFTAGVQVPQSLKRVQCLDKRLMGKHISDDISKLTNKHNVKCKALDCESKTVRSNTKDVGIQAKVHRFTKKSDMPKSVWPHQELKLQLSETIKKCESAREVQQRMDDVEATTAEDREEQILKVLEKHASLHKTMQVKSVENTNKNFISNTVKRFNFSDERAIDCDNATDPKNITETEESMRESVAN